MANCDKTLCAFIALVTLCGCAGVDVPFTVSSGGGSVGVDRAEPMMDDEFDLRQRGGVLRDPVFQRGAVDGAVADCLRVKTE